MKKHFFILIGIIILENVITVPSACAGMPFFTLTDIASFRISAISFFLLVYFLASFTIFKLWNYLRRDFNRLPALSFRKSLAAVLLLGFAFHLLLVMIAGTRELMAPEAWEKAGVVRKLSPDQFEQIIKMRRFKLDRLREALWQFAKKHDGKFPGIEEQSSISKTAWSDPTGKQPYKYVPGLKIDKSPRPLAYEPDAYGQERFVLFTNGHIELLSLQNIQNLLEKQKS